jgi:hypothetical protein
MTPLPVELAPCRARRRTALARHRLWSHAVGIVSGEPKCCKSFLASILPLPLLRVSPWLRRFAVDDPGLSASMPPRKCLPSCAGGSRASWVPPASTSPNSKSAPFLRLDLEVDRRSLVETVAKLNSRKLILNPFVHLHREHGMSGID